MKTRTPIIEQSDEQLAEQPPEVHLDKPALDRIARLALLTAAAMNRRERLVLPDVRWEDKTPEQQAAARRGVLRVIQALASLGYIEVH